MEAIQHALPNFDAAGHFNYTKSADLYLRSMVDLESTIKYQGSKRLSLLSDKLQS